MAMLEEELRQPEFKCHNILRAQKMQQLWECSMKAWLLEEVSLYVLAASEPKKHELISLNCQRDQTRIAQHWGELPEHLAAYEAFARDPPEEICCWQFQFDPDPFWSSCHHPPQRTPSPGSPAKF